MTTNNTKLTENEIKGLKGIIGSEYNSEGAKVTAKGNLITSGVWTFSANTFDNPRSFSGVVASLVKKGLVISQEDSGNGENDAILMLTEAGWDVCVAQRLIEAGGVTQAPVPVVETKPAEVAPKASGKIEFAVTGYTKDDAILFTKTFKSKNHINAVLNAGDYFAKQNISLDSAHRLEILPV